MTCTTCAVGCRGALQSSSNRLVRLLGVDLDAVNQGWLCDKGRYGYEWVHAEERVIEPQVRRGGALTQVSWPEALEAVAGEIRRALELHGPGSIAVLGGARGSNEDAYAWAKLAKGVIGTDNVDCQLGDGLPAEVVLGLPQATIDESASSSRFVPGFWAELGERSQGERPSTHRDPEGREATLPPPKGPLTD